VHDEETIQAWKQAFGRRVRGLRKARGMKQDVLAEALHDRSRTSISHIERGREDPPLTKILACAKQLGVQPHELFLREPHEEAVAAVADQLPPPLRQLLAIWQALAEEDRGPLMGYAEVLQHGDAELRQSARAHLRVLRRAMRERGREEDSSEVDSAPAS
jgi:transcriptional regulator with XRE-family HTH domain